MLRPGMHRSLDMRELVWQPDPRQPPIVQRVWSVSRIRRPLWTRIFGAAMLLGTAVLVGTGAAILLEVYL